MWMSKFGPSGPDLAAALSDTEAGVGILEWTGKKGEEFRVKRPGFDADISFKDASRRLRDAISMSPDEARATSWEAIRKALVAAGAPAEVVASLVGPLSAYMKAEDEQVGVDSLVDGMYGGQ